MAHGKPSDFNNDVKLGKIGEKILIRMLEDSGNCVLAEDLSSDKRFMLVDVDIAQYKSTKKDGSMYTSDDILNNLIGEDKKRDFATLYEVKTDTKSHNTRNVVYEVISHDGAGCAARSMADTFFYVFVDDDDRPVEAWFIDLKKWRKYIRENCYNVVRISELKYGGIALHNFNDNGDKGMNILTNIDLMRENKIALKVRKKDLEKYVGTE